MFRIEVVKQFQYTDLIYSSNDVRTLLYAGEPVAHAAHGVCWVKVSAKRLEENKDSNSSKSIQWFLTTFKHMWEHNAERIVYGNFGGAEALRRLSISIQ